MGNLYSQAVKKTLRAKEQNGPLGQLFGPQKKHVYIYIYIYICILKILSKSQGTKPIS